MKGSPVYKDRKEPRRGFRVFPIPISVAAIIILVSTRLAVHPAQAHRRMTIKGSRSQYGNLILPPPPEEIEETETEDSEDESDQRILQTIVQRIVFPFENLAAGVRNSLAALFTDTASAAMEPMGEALDHALTMLLPTNMLGELRWEAWRAMAKVAAALLPLALMITVGSAMREGVTSITGYAQAREALLGWLMGVGAAAASYLLLEKAIVLSGGAAVAVQEALSKEIFASANPGEHLLGGIINLRLISAANPLFQLFLGFFALFTMIAIVASVTMALLAREVLLLLLVAIAPVILLLGSMGPLRWLSGLWTKAVVVSLLLGPINVLLLSLTALVTTHANSVGSGVGGAILGMLVGVGVISVLLAVNGTVGKMIYGAAMVVANKALGSVMGVLQLTALATGFAVAPAAGGFLSKGTGLLPPGRGPGGVPSFTATETGRSRPKIGDQGHSPIFGLGRPGPINVGGRGNHPSGQDVTNAIGATLAASKNPIARGFGQGIRLSGMAGALQPPVSPPSRSSNAQPLDVGKEVSAAREELLARFAKNESSAMNRFGLSQHSAEGSIDEGIQVAKNAFAAMGDLGIDPGDVLRDLGYFHSGEGRGAAARFARVNAGSWAFRGRNPYEPPSVLVPPRHGVSGHDVQAALDILGGSVRGEGSIAATPKMIRQVALTVHQVREQHGSSIPDIVGQASQRGSRAALLDWMRDAYYNLPDRGQADDLAEALGIAGTDSD